jgi:CRP-like cAMP-binding protein
MSEKSQPFIDIVRLELHELMRRQGAFPEESRPAGSILVETGPLLRALILIEGEVEEFEPSWNPKEPGACLRSVGPGSGIGLEYFADDAFYPLKAVAKTDVRFYVVDWDALKETSSQPGILMQRVGHILRAAGSDLQKQRMTALKLLANHAIAEDALAQESAARVSLQASLDGRSEIERELAETKKELANVRLMRNHQQLLIETLQSSLAALQNQGPELEKISHSVEELKSQVDTQARQIQAVRSQSAEMEMRMKLLGETLPKLVGIVPPLQLLELLIPLFESMMDSRNDTLIEAGKSMMSALFIANAEQSRSN